MNGLALIGGLFGLAGIIAALIAYLKTNIDSNTITIQKQNIEALLTQNDILKTERDETREQNIELHKKVSALEGQITTLQNLVTQTPQVAKLADDMLKQHNAVVSKLSALAKTIAKDRKDERNAQAKQTHNRPKK